MEILIAIICLCVGGAIGGAVTALFMDEAETYRRLIMHNDYMSKDKNLFVRILDYFPPYLDPAVNVQVIWSRDHTHEIGDIITIPLEVFNKSYLEW